MKVDSQGAMLEKYDRERDLYESWALELSTVLEKLLVEGSVKRPHTVAHRAKDKTSLKRKLARDAGTKYAKLEDVTDLAGVRAVTYYYDDVDRVAEIIEREFEIDRENSEDKRKPDDPRMFGYASLHYVVSLEPERAGMSEYRRFAGLKAEIQVRSLLQHAWAEVEHGLGYKPESVPEGQARGFAGLAGMFEVADKEFMRMREELRKHAETVEDEMASEPKSVSIDRASLTAFLKNNLTVRDLDGRIASATGGTVYTQHDYVDTTHIAQIVQQLRWLSITDVRKLEEELDARKSQIEPFAVAWLRLRGKDHTRFFAVGVSVVYLIYLVAVERLEGEGLEEFIFETRVVGFPERAEAAGHMLAARAEVTR